MGLAAAYSLWRHFTGGQTETQRVGYLQADNLVADLAVF